MIRITSRISINEKNILEEFIRSSGPGGQNVNKVATAVQLRFDIARSGLPEIVKERLINLGGRRIADNSILIITARRYRTQEKNRKDGLERLISIIRKACEKPGKRKGTTPTNASIERRLKNKRSKSKIKKHRLNRTLYDE